MSITTNNLTYTYSEGGPFEAQAIRNITLSIEDGEFVAIIGHTGSGKTTLVQHFNALTVPTSGSIVVQGIDLMDKKADKRALRQKVGLVFQYPEYQLFEETIYKDIAFGPTNLKLPKDEIDRRVKKAMQDVGLEYERFAELSPFEVSGGEKRRVAIAGIIAMQPEVLILDEPAAGLDPRGREAVLDLVEHLHDSLQITVIMVSHSMDDVARLADRIIVMHQGEIAMQGTPKEVFIQRDALVQMGLGIPEVGEIVAKLNEKGFQLPAGESDLDTVASLIAETLVQHD